MGGCRFVSISLFEILFEDILFLVLFEKRFYFQYFLKRLPFLDVEVYS